MRGPAGSQREVFHYTSLSGFQGIVGGREMWATHYRFLNDSKEYAYGRDLIVCGIVDRLGTHAPEGSIRALLDVALSSLPVEAHVSCFTELSDDLAQWRGYSRGPTLCIGLLAPEGATNVSYAHDSLDDRILRGINASVTPLTDFLEQYRLTRISQSSDSFPRLDEDQELLRDLRHLVMSLQREVVSRAILIKHPSFAAEREVRLVTWISSTEMADRVQFRTSDTLTPYVAVKMKSLPLTRVIVGPTSEFARVADGVRIFLDSHGFQSIPIIESAIPFRG